MYPVGPFAYPGTGVVWQNPVQPLPSPPTGIPSLQSSSFLLANRPALFNTTHMWRPPSVSVTHQHMLQQQQQQQLQQQQQQQLQFNVQQRRQVLAQTIGRGSGLYKDENTGQISQVTPTPHQSFLQDFNQAQKYRRM